MLALGRLLDFLKPLLLNYRVGENVPGMRDILSGEMIEADLGSILKL